MYPFLELFLITTNKHNFVEIFINYDQMQENLKKKKKLTSEY